MRKFGFVIGRPKQLPATSRLQSSGNGKTFLVIQNGPRERLLLLRQTLCGRMHGVTDCLLFCLQSALISSPLRVQQRFRAKGRHRRLPRMVLHGPQHAVHFLLVAPKWNVWSLTVFALFHWEPNIPVTNNVVELYVSRNWSICIL